MWKIAGEDATVLIDFKVDGDYVVPDQAWITVRGNTGTVLTATTALTFTGTSTSYTVPAAQNQIAPSADLEYRYLNVVFNHDGAQYRMDLSYKLMPFVPMTTTPDQVRAELGLDASELPDRDIDIPLAYLQLKRDYAEPFTNALVSGGVNAPLANQAIALKAAVNLTHSLPFRAGVEFAGEENKFKRMSEFDATQIRVELGRKLGSILAALEDDALLGTALVVLGTPTDPVTGA